MRSPAARARLRIAVLPWLGLAWGCSHGLTFDQFRSRVAGPRPGYARIFVYTPLRSEALGFRPDVTLDGAVVGTSSPGTFFFVDREPGVYELTVPRKRSLSAFGNEGAAEPARVSLFIGQSAFVQIDVMEFGTMVEARLRTREASDGERFIRTCRFDADAAP